MKKFPSVCEVCTLKPGALEMKVSDRIANLEEAIASLEKGENFFQKTHPTNGLKELMNGGIARLGGYSSQAVFHLKQAMGGGKTHLLTCMGLLARHSKLRQKYCPELHQRYPFEEAAVATFNGRNFNTLFWEELAQQLKRADVFKNATMHTPPDEKGWLKLFADNRPCLILLDELPPYLAHHSAISSGKGSQADLLCQSFSSLLTAASNKSNVCIILSDLHAAYKESGKMIGEALQNAQQEVGRQEKTIIPVDLTGEEMYAILRKMLFETLPSEETIREIADAYAEELKEAKRSNTVDRSAPAIADEIASTYPFHPKLKNLIALFKENEKFRQTRGLIVLISRLLRSVWEQKDENAFLIGAEQFDFSIADVRTGFDEINPMPEVVTNDIWDEKGGAITQKFAPESKHRSGQKVASLLFTSSLSTSVNAIKGLSESDLLECLIAPRGGGGGGGPAPGRI